MSQQKNNEALWGELNSQTARIQWSELQRYFAKGLVVSVAPDLDLVDIAIKLVQDNAGEIGPMIAEGMVVRATDDHARKWTDRDPELWAVVVAPWVLVQER